MVVKDDGERVDGGGRRWKGGLTGKTDGERGCFPVPRGQKGENGAGERTSWPLLKDEEETRAGDGDGAGERRKRSSSRRGGRSRVGVAAIMRLSSTRKLSPSSDPDERKIWAELPSKLSIENAAASCGRDCSTSSGNPMKEDELEWLDDEEVGETDEGPYQL